MRRLESMVVFGGDKTRDVIRTVCSDQSLLLSSYCQMVSDTSMPLWSQIESTLKTGITRAVDKLASAAAKLSVKFSSRNQERYDKALKRAKEAFADIIKKITEKLPTYEEFGGKFKEHYEAIQIAKTEVDKLSGEEKRRLIKEFSEGPNGHVRLNTQYTNGVFHPFLDVWNNAGPVLSARNLSEAEREYEKHFCLFVAVSYCKIHPLGGGAKKYVFDFDSKVITTESGKFICEVDADDLEISDQMIYGIEEWGKVLQGGQNLQMATGDIKLLLETIEDKLSTIALDVIEDNSDYYDSDSEDENALSQVDCEQFQEKFPTIAEELGVIKLHLSDIARFLRTWIKSQTELVDFNDRAISNRLNPKRLTEK